MKQTENEMNVSVPLEVIKASEIEPKDGLSTLFQTNFFRLFFRYCTGV